MGWYNHYKGEAALNQYVVLICIYKFTCDLFLDTRDASFFLLEAYFQWDVTQLANI